MKDRNDYINEAPAYKVRMKQVNTSITYVRSLQSEINDITKRLDEIKVQKQIALFLTKVDAETMHRLI